MSRSYGVDCCYSCSRGNPYPDGRPYITVRSPPGLSGFFRVSPSVTRDNLVQLDIRERFVNIKAAFVEVYGIGLAAVIGPREEDIVFIVIFAYLCDTGVICPTWHVERLTLRLRRCSTYPRQTS